MQRPTDHSVEALVVGGAVVPGVLDVCGEPGDAGEAVVHGVLPLTAYDCNLLEAGDLLMEAWKVGCQHFCKFAALGLATVLATESR